MKEKTKIFSLKSKEKFIHFFKASVKDNILGAGFKNLAYHRKSATKNTQNYAA